MENLERKSDKIFRLNGVIQHYDWGGNNFIPNLISETVEINKTYAEYWLGAHLKAPSIIKINEKSVSLDLFLNENIKENLGNNTAKVFGKLPFLFKVLDVNKMLSIQVHPTKDAAIIGYKKENEKGIKLTAKNRNFKDQNHKPEIMVALGDFWLLHGFLEREKLLQNLTETKELNFLKDLFKEEGYHALYKKVMEFSQKEVNVILKPLVDRILPNFINNKLVKSSPEYWAAKSVINKKNENIDRGIFSIYFFNILNLSKGEAIFQDAGLPHAYLEGKNIELMANSDNVLRGGLTSKHIDVKELLKNTKFEETIPNILNGIKNDTNSETFFKTEAKDFQLSKIESTSSLNYSTTSNSVEILVSIKGTALVQQGKKVVKLEKGNSVFIKANTDYKISSHEGVEIYKASVPKSL